MSFAKTAEENETHENHTDVVQEVDDGLGGPSCWLDNCMYLALRVVKDMLARPELIFGVWRYGEGERHGQPLIVLTKPT